MIRSTLLLLALTLAPVCFGDTTADSSRMLVHLLSYIRADYGGAVENGRVVSEAEYTEQLDFLKQASDLSRLIPELKDHNEFQKKYVTFKEAVERKSDATTVARLAGELEAQAIQLAKIEITPRRWPDVHHGKMLFDRQCAQCHGANGNGDGPSGANLDPKPTDFHSDKMNELPPFQAYNTIRLGVPGTGMASFHDLSPNETWDLAFYVLSLRYQGQSAKGVAELPRGISLKEVATSSDATLLKKLPGNETEKRDLIRRVRLHVEQNESTFFFEARRLLNQSLQQAQAGDWTAAKISAVASYLEGIEPIEPPLRRKNPALIESIERKMAEVRRAIDLKSPELKGLISDAISLVVTAEEQSKKQESTPWVAFLIAFGIITREALEAILVLITVLGVTKSFGSRSATRAIHAGWMVAVGAGLLTWFAAGRLITITGADREWMEGIVALIAVMILIYMGFWLHQKTEIGKWRQFVEKMVGEAMERKSVVAFVLLSFTTVYREMFESVLFLQALSLEVGSAQNYAIGWGAAAALLTMGLFTAAASRLSVKLPVRQLCQLSSWMMIVLAVVLLGKAVHAFQEVGVVPMTLLPASLRIELLGIFPTYETFAAQVVGLVVVLGIFFLKLRVRPS